MGEITQLLAGAQAGDAGAENALYARVYGELRSLARHHLRRQRTVTQLDAASLVHEAYLRLAGRDDLAFENRAAFYAYASRVMRNVVLDQVREKSADKRGGGAAALTLTTSIEDSGLRGVDLFAVDQALKELSRIDARGHDLFEMHFFGGLGVPEICSARALSPATVKRDLRKARAFLFQALGAGAP